MKIYFKNIFLLLIILLPKYAAAYNFEVNGIYYIITNSNEAQVTYKNNNYNSYSGDITIPEKVTNNGMNYSVTSIGERAFSECSNLTSIIIPNSVTSIGYAAFYGCIRLTQMIIPNSVNSIGNYAFECCSGLTSIVLSNSLTTISSLSFHGCSGLTNVTIPSSVKVIDDGAFYGCSGLKSIDIGNSVSTIGNQAFCNCSSLSSITIGNSVTSIGDWAFGLCNMTNITIPKSVSSIGTSPFGECSRLDCIVVDESNPKYDSRENCNAIIETSSNTLIQGCDNTVIPNTISSIRENAFRCCSRMTNINIPNSVISIGQYAFFSCKGLTSIIIPNSVRTIGDHAFRECFNLSTVSIGKSVVYIGDWSFLTNRSLNVTIRGNIETVGSRVFSGISSLYVTSEVSSLPCLNISPNKIYCYSTVPPTCQEGTFSAYNGVLHVPATSLAAYFTAPIWENFDNMMGDAVEPLSIKLSQTEIEIPLGETAWLTATILPNGAYPNTITWSSSNTDIATVENGIVKAVSTGECDIIATCLDKQAICHVFVKDATITITLDHNEAQVLPNHIITLIPTASSDVLPELAVSSSEPSIASARASNGIIRIVGIKEGTTTITVGSVDGTAIPATCLVTVYTEPGDLNCDGFLTISDVTSIIDYLLSDYTENIKVENADVNSDGNISISDVTTLIDILLSEE